MKTTLSVFLAMKRRILWLFIMLSVLVLSCSDDDSPGFPKEYCTKTSLDCNNFYPQHVGDYWIYSSQHKFEITSSTVVDGKTYYTLTEFSSTGSVLNTFYERVEDGKVFTKYSLEDEYEEVFADFSLDIGGEWVLPYEPGTMTVTLESKSKEVVLNGISFTNAYFFGRTYSEYPAAFIPITFLPGIGYVAQENYQNEVKQGLPHTYYLKEFKIDGKVYRIKK
jgi:hypothetical protein